VGHTDKVYVTTGLEADLGTAMKDATRNARVLLGQRLALPEHITYGCLSAAGNLAVSQVVDGVQGVHFSLRRRPRPADMSLTRYEGRLLAVRQPERGVQTGLSLQFACRVTR
jgi:hypothetical protein